MNEHQIKTIENFEKTIQPFLGLWRSLVIRVAWTKTKDVDMVVYLNATFDADESSIIQPPSASPAVDGLQASWFIRPASEIAEFIKNLKAGCTLIDGKKLQPGWFEKTNGRMAALASLFAQRWGMG